MKFYSESDFDRARMIRIEFEEACKEAYEEGRREGLRIGVLERIAIRCLKKGMPIAEIMKITELTEDEILEIQKELNKK